MYTIKYNQRNDDKRANEILNGLAEGLSRQHLAEQFGHKNYKTLDIYMRRKGFTWDRINLIYVSKTDSNPAAETAKPTDKAGIVLRMMEAPDFNMQLICQKAGFQDHRQLAEFMTAEGYIWSSKEQVFRKTGGKPFNDIAIPKHNPSAQSPDPFLLIQQYVPLLQWLATNKDKISRWIEPARQIPTYLQDLAETFCVDHNIRQQELFEVALIDYFQKHGYSSEEACGPFELQ